MNDTAGSDRSLHASRNLLNLSTRLLSPGMKPGSKVGKNRIQAKPWL